MLVYGDALTREPTQALVVRLRESRARALSAPPGERRDALERLLLDAGELTQGLLDVDFRRRGADAPSPLRALLERLGSEIALAFVASLARGADDARGPFDAVDELARARLPGSVVVSAPEGYAFYALYPELYARAAAALRARAPGNLQVIGVRSIGASLAPVVAASAGGRARTTLVRPTGHPFARTLSVAEGLAREVFADRAALFAVVDDGPGLSGSSFGAVGDWIERHGVARDKVVYFPGHAGPLGPRASDAHRARWASARRVVVEADEAFLRAQLAEPQAPLVDVSGGGWRPYAFARVEEWPPVVAQLERRKALVGEGDARRLFKFTGLGRFGEAKRARAEHLARAGLAPPVIAFRRGFLGSPWIDGERLPSPRVARDRAREGVAAYLAELAASFPAPAGREGASPAKLLAMATHNAAAALGAAYGRELERWAEHTSPIARRARHVLTDNRMHAWEWLAARDGRLLKCDAVDHHASHDMIGAQDIAWDVAGAWIELDLAEDDVAYVVERVARRAGPRAAPAHLPFYVDAYLAFQLGAYTLAQEQTKDEAELGRLRDAARRYADRLRRRIET